MNVVIVELRNEILASETPERLSADGLNVKYPRGSIYVSQDGCKSWFVINRGSPVHGMKFSSRPRVMEIPGGSLPEVVRLAAMLYQ